MKVKIGDTTYDSNNEPIMIIMTKMDKYNIKNMAPDSDRYASFPKDTEFKTQKSRKAWMQRV